MQTARTGRPMRPIIGVIALLVLALALGILLGSAAAGGGIFGVQPTPSPTLRTPRPAPSPTPLDTSIIASAVVVPLRSAELAASASGRVAEILVEPEQEVSADQPLLRLDSSKAQAAVNLAGADARRAEAALERARLELEAVPEDGPAADLDAAQAALSLARAELDVARSTLADAETALEQTELRAPWDATVVAVNVSEGEQAEVGEPVITIADLSGWLIETTDLGELDVVRIAVGDRVAISFEALPDLQLQGTVSRIQVRGTTLEGGVLFGVEVRPDEHRPELRWNMTATVTLAGR